MKTLGIVLVMMFFSIHLSAGIYGPVKVTGKVLKYDKDKVILIQTLGKNQKKQAVIPRSAIPKGVKLRTGKTVTAVFSAQEIMKNLKAVKKQKKTKPAGKNKVKNKTKKHTKFFRQ